MAEYSNQISPVGWYVGSYLLRFIEIGAEDNECQDTKFVTWENTVIVKASDLDEAFSKIEAVAMRETSPYEGCAEGVPVKWTFEGVTDVLPIYEALEDGAEIMWEEHSPLELRTLRKKARSLAEIKSRLISAQRT